MDSEDLFVDTPELAGPTNGQLNGNANGNANGGTLHDGQNGGAPHDRQNGGAPQNGQNGHAAASDDDETQMEDAVAELSLNNDIEIAAAEAAAAAESNVYNSAESLHSSTNGNGHHSDHHEPLNDMNGLVDEFEDDDATEMQLPLVDEDDNGEIAAEEVGDEGDVGNYADEAGDDEDAAGECGDDEDQESAGAAAGTSTDAAASARDPPRLTQLPLSRVKALMKVNVEFGLASSEAVFMMCKATELFIESLVQESFAYTAEARKKTVQRKDLEKAIESVDALMFLEGAL